MSLESFVRRAFAFGAVVVACGAAFHANEAQAQYYHSTGVYSSGMVRTSWSVPYSSGTVIAPAPVVYSAPVYRTVGYAPVTTSYYAPTVHSSTIYSSGSYYGSPGVYGSSTVVVSTPYSTTRVVGYAPPVVIAPPLPPPPPVYIPAPVFYYPY